MPTRFNKHMRVEFVGVDVFPPDVPDRIPRVKLWSIVAPILGLVGICGVCASVALLLIPRSSPVQATDNPLPTLAHVSEADAIQTALFWVYQTTTPTATPSPTATATPTITPTPTASATPTATPDMLATAFVMLSQTPISTIAPTQDPNQIIDEWLATGTAIMDIRSTLVAQGRSQ